MQPSSVRREFLMTDQDFSFIRQKVHAIAGIALSEQKRELVYSRLARRLRLLQLEKFSDYCQLLESASGNLELNHFINALTTNLTSFFRERHHFDLLQQRLLPELLIRNAASQKLRIWSAGCSTGEEPYSIAMVLAQALAGRTRWDARIWATDLDTNVLATASAGSYRAERLAEIPTEYARRFCSMSPEQLQMQAELQALISFRPLNLISRWNLNGPMDIIFCRNVVIYFDKPTQQKVFENFYQLLSPGGYLCLGHSESLGAMQPRFEVLGRTLFRKI